jgi:phosphatidylserine/phosphatidylglycerophosphate/cardiolipin synthase-like enzyme
MPSFFSPLDVADLGGWTLSPVEEVTIPLGLRYAGYKFRGVAASRADAKNVRCPALGVLRRVTEGTGTFVEVQVNPFPVRTLIAKLTWGVPTFYLVFGDASGLTAFADDDTAAGDESLGTATSVTIVCAGQDRVSRDPALWAQQITDAINLSGGDPAAWEPFRAAVSAATDAGDDAPVLLLDHAGRPQTEGDVDIIIGAATHRATLALEDHGDLQKTVARMNAADPSTMPISNLWGSATSFDLRPHPSVEENAVQLARLEDGTAGVGLIRVTPLLRHITYTNLDKWFAPQLAIPVGATVPPLAQFTRGNKVTPYVNGPPFFEHLFRRLHEARTPGAGFHLTGLGVSPETEMTRRRAGDPSDLALTLADAARLIGEDGGGCRFLPSQFFQLEPGVEFQAAEAMIFLFIMEGVLVLGESGVSFARTDGAGAVLLLAAWIASTIYINHVFDEGGRPLERNKDAVNTLEEIENTFVHLSPYPATVVDNPNATLSGFPFGVIFNAIRHFGSHHQKLGVVLAPFDDGPTTVDRYFGYCGGIDLVPNRLNTTDYLTTGPYHDLHALVEGPAVHDLALSFEQRWQHDQQRLRREEPGREEERLAFDTPPAAILGQPGSDIVQVARTYFNSIDPEARGFDFAPAGDFTIAHTLLNAIASASEFIYIEDQYFTPPEEYAAALLQKVDEGKIRKLIIMLPAVTDQPFGEIERTGLVDDLRARDRGRGIVHVGYPRRHYTVPDNDIRSASGKCLLGEDLPAGSGVNPTIVLGPKARLPLPPFWVAVEGEMMWVYDEAPGQPADPQFKRFAVDRGSDTRFVKVSDSDANPLPREHKAGAAATVVENSGIYVHAKMMIVDDVFLSIGSANLNRRGLFHDSELNIFTVPQALRAVPPDPGYQNPIAALRRQLWAEMMNLPAEMAGPLLEDPLAAAQLFGRSPFAGNRFVEYNAAPVNLMPGGVKTGTDMVSALGSLIFLGNLLASYIAVEDQVKIFETAVDPTSDDPTI